MSIDVTLWEHARNEIQSEHQRKVDAALDSAREMLIQHKIMIGALKSFFNASEEVSQTEFSIFSKDLLKIKLAIAFTLNEELKPTLISDPSFINVISAGVIERKNQEIHDFRLDGFETILIPIDVPHMPYLVYAISHERVQKKIDSNTDMCEHFILGGAEFENKECNLIDQSFLYDVIGINTEYKVKIQEYGLNYTLVVGTLPSEQKLFEVSMLLLTATIFGISSSLLLFIFIQNRLNVTREQTETNSKIALLSTLNHEIRTPINAVLGYAEMLKAMSSCNASGQEVLEKIIWSANLLNSVAQNTLMYSKAATGPLELHYENVDLNEFLKSISDYYEAFGKTQGKNLIIKVDELPWPTYALDKTKFFQLITNFINNSFKYSSGDNVIVKVSVKNNASVNKGLSCPKVDGFIRVAVRDFGKGMSSESKLALSRPFTIDSKSATALKSGIGIGLYTCKKVIESVGGSIRIRSELGKGTLVLFNFPYREVSEEHIVNAMPEPSKMDFCERIEKEVESCVIGAPKKVILVDDNVFNLEVCKSMLEIAGFTVFPVQTVEELFSLLKKLDVKPLMTSKQKLTEFIVLMDYKLGNTNGLTLIKSLQTQGYRQMRYFILSANSKDEIPDSESVKDVDFLEKPLDLAILREQLNLPTDIGND
ncbi:ATP-binding response regulator [Shewanella spartinae]|uniref:ATP-binding response regulator n=1 Tax=Shewanella spartinae TaxID=2864205 RepID=UPI001C65C8C4|nr:hybrid sensor histidine kinase/response regulator [Shewanella spartinae]QYJ95697.1 response regulator [Shewanella spartinae]